LGFDFSNSVVSEPESYFMRQYQSLKSLGAARVSLISSAWFFVLSAVVLSFSFAINAFGAASPDFFEQWQIDSDGIVVQSILDRKTDQSFFEWGLARNQQIGSQGHFFLMVSAFFGFVDFEALRLLSAILTGILTAVVGAQILNAGNTSLAVIWLVVALASPWFVSAARNLYWIPWSWILPLALVGWMVFAKSRALKITLHAMLFLALVFRFAAGYEFVSAILIMITLFPLVLNRVETKSIKAKKHLFGGVDSPIAVGSTGSLAFISTLLIHSAMRVPGDIPAGIMDIINQDVLRRTHGNPLAFDPVFSASLESSTLGVVMMYFTGWWTPFLELKIADFVHLSIGAPGLMVLIALLAFTILFRLVLRHKVPSGYMLILTGAILIPVSWLALAKGHSAIHLHINFVLWYPMGVAIMAHLLWLNLKVIWRAGQENRKTNNMRESRILKSNSRLAPDKSLAGDE
jgi:hypothetical protein